MLPPLAQRIADAMAFSEPMPGMAGGRASLIVNVGSDAWEGRRGPFPTMVAPPDVDPSTFDWTLCRGHDPILVRRCGFCPDAMVERLAQALLRDGVERVLELHAARLWRAAA